MDTKIKKSIDDFFVELTFDLGKTSMTEDRKIRIFYQLLSEFYEMDTLSENGETTIGIQTIWQLNIFCEKIPNYLAIKNLNEFQKGTKIKDFEQVVNTTNKAIYILNKKKLFSEYNGEKLDDWEILMLGYFENELDYLQKKPALKLQKQKKYISYVWQSNPDKELPELYNLMKSKDKLISPETTCEQFKAVFTGQPTESIKPIKWIENTVLLAYFLEKAFIGLDWQSIAGNGKLFLSKKGNIVNANNLSASKDHAKYWNPKGYEKIDLILKSIK